VYFSSDRGGSFALWRVPSEGGSAELVAPSIRFPTISGDGTKLAYSNLPDNRDLVLRDLRAGTEQDWGGTLKEWMPALSRDGRSIFFVSDRAGGSDQLWMVPVADFPSKTSSPQPLTGFKEPVSHPSVSPDGLHVAFYRIFGKQGERGDRRELWVADVAGGQPRPLTTDHIDIHPAWSPIGTPGRVAFVRETGGVLHIWTVAVRSDGSPAGPPQQLTSGTADESAPAWSPDGKWIAYISEPRYMEGDVMVVGADRPTPPVAIVKGAAAQRVKWYGADGRALMVVGLWGG
jgi:Tol biopolymer transport system component